MKNLDLKELRDLINNKKQSVEVREAAKVEFDRRHAEMERIQALEKFEASFWGGE